MEARWKSNEAYVRTGGNAEKAQRKRGKPCGLLNIPRARSLERLLDLARWLCVEGEQRGVFTFGDQVLRSQLIQRRW